MFRFLGGICVLASFIIMGQKKCHTILQCKYARERWYQKMLALKGEMEVGQTPLSELFLHLSNRQEQVEEKFFYSVSEQLKKEDYENDEGYFEDVEHRHFFDIWKSQMKMLKPLKLDEVDFLSFGEHLGNCDRKTQNQYVEYYLKQLRTQIDGETSELKAQQKLASTLYTCAGFIVMIVFIF